MQNRDIILPSCIGVHIVFPRAYNILSCFVDKKQDVTQADVHRRASIF